MDVGKNLTLSDPLALTDNGVRRYVGVRRKATTEGKATMTTTEPLASIPARNNSRSARNLRTIRSAGTGSATIAILESAWVKVRRFAKTYADVDLPYVQIVTGSAMIGAPRGYLRMGSFIPELWEARKAEGKVHEIFIAGETLGAGADVTLTTLLHEAAHVLAWVKGEKDTTRQRRYHNGNFRKNAETFGLEYRHERAHEDLGYSDVTLSDFGRVLWGEELEALATTVAVIGGAQLAHPEDPSDPRRTTEPGTVRAPAAPQRRRQTYTCGCRSMLMHADEMALGPVVCGVCGNEYHD